MEYSREEENLIVADSFGELTHRQKAIFLYSADESRADAQKFCDELIKTLGVGVYNKIVQNFCDKSYRGKILARLVKKNIFCVTEKSALYPAALKEIPVPPHVLYCKGNANLLNTQCFAVVGSRRTLPAALAACRSISEELTAKFTVVTGVADGADSAAAEGALGSGKLVCVLPNGFDYVYPAGNAELLRRVERNGLLVTEFTADTPPQKYLFPVRNRVIAGLSKGVLVVSAAKRSGALITAGYAADYGRDVFAFPYSPGVASGEGCNRLIKSGAYLTENVLDIFSCFGLEYNPTPAEELSSDERAVLEFIRQNGEAHLQSIANAVGKRAFEAAAICSSLEIKSLIAKTGGNKYAALK